MRQRSVINAQSYSELARPTLNAGEFEAIPTGSFVLAFPSRPIVSDLSGQILAF